MSLLSFPEISVNSSFVTRGDNYKLLNQTFTTTHGIYTDDTPGLCGTRLVIGARLLSAQASESDSRPICGARRLPGPGTNRSFTVYVYEMNTRQRTKGGSYINTTVQLQQFRCYCGAILMYPFLY